MEVQLRVKTEGKPDQKVTISKNVTVGRSKTCQFRVMSNDVSREHCQFILGEGSLAVRDLGSANGTQVNGQTIPPQTDFPVPSGGMVDIGPLKFVVKYQSAQSEPAAETTAPPSVEAVPDTIIESPRPAMVEKTEAPKPATQPKPAKAAQKPAKPAPVVVPEPVAEADEPQWPSFGDDADEGPTVARTPAVAPAESKSDFSLEDLNVESAPDTLIETPKKAAEPKKQAEQPAAPAAVVKPAEEPVAETSTAPAAATEELPGFLGGSDDGPGFSFDFEEAAESTPAADASASPAPSPVATPQPAAEKPGKLKSLFGLFSKGKKEAASPAQKAEAPAPEVETPATPAATDSEEAAWFSGGGDDAGDVPDFLSQVTETVVEPVSPVAAPAPVAPKSPAKAPAPAPAKAAAPAPKAEAPKAASAAPAKAKAKPAGAAEKNATPKPAPAAAPAPAEEPAAFPFGGEVAGGEESANPEFADFLNQLGK